METKEHIFFHLTFTCAVSKLMFNSGEFCYSAADDSRVKQKLQKSVFVLVSEII